MKDTNRRFDIRRSCLIRSPPEGVHRLLVDPQTWPRWQSEIVSIEPSGPLEDGDVARGEADMLGFKVHGHTTAIAVGRELFEEDVFVGVRLKIRYEVRAAPEGSIVTHRLVAKLPGGFSGRVLSLFLRRRLRRLQKTSLDNLARYSEETPLR
jgi:hypothetical protein